MKKVFTILAFTLLPILAIGQNSNADIKTQTNDILIENAVATEKVETKTTSNSAARAQVLKINRKKSTDIISVKAYRKSLQIKVKTVRLC
ncbi:MAG: hypothetical protein GYB32_08895 [Algicola sp.]|nr:hypothetical protein [Algicola sp.]